MLPLDSSKRCAGDSTTSADITYRHNKLTDRRLDQIATEQADGLISSGRGDPLLTATIIQKAVDSDKVRPFLEGYASRKRPTANIGTLDGAKSVLTRELYGMLVAGGNLAETVKQEKVEP